MAYENNEKRQDSVFSKKIRAGKRRTYFFDIRATRGSDFFLTITESRKRFDADGYERHKIFVYKEDFNKFLTGLTEAVDYVKTELMPDFDFDAFNHEYPEAEGDTDQPPVAEIEISTPAAEAQTAPLPSQQFGKITNQEEVDKW